MNKLAFTLVGISIFSHAHWNYLVKTSGRKHIFIALSKITASTLLIVPACLMLRATPPELNSLAFVVTASILTGLNYLFVAMAYDRGELSLIYPVSRSGVMFIPLLALIAMDERLGPAGWMATGIIILGSIIMHLDELTFRGLSRLRARLSNPGTFYAILAALMLASYTVVGKMSAAAMHPLLYFSLYTFLTTAGYAIISFARCPPNEVKREWQENSRKIIQVAILDGGTFLLVLLALGMAKASFVGGLRQLGILAGLYYGFEQLGEKVPVARIIGAVISIAGAIILLFAE